MQPGDLIVWSLSHVGKNDTDLGVCVNNSPGACYQLWVDDRATFIDGIRTDERIREAIDECELASVLVRAHDGSWYAEKAPWE